MSRGVRRPSLRWVSGLMIAGLLLGSAVAVGQDRTATGRAPAEAPAAGGGDGNTSAAGEERNEGGEKVKVFRFSGFDISGRLKSPQLLYFLNRMRAEFDRPHLPHRSFMPELNRSTKGKAL